MLIDHGLIGFELFQNRGQRKRASAQLFRCSSAHSLSFSVTRTPTSLLSEIPSLLRSAYIRLLQVGGARQKMVRYLYYVIIPWYKNIQIHKTHLKYPKRLTMKNNWHRSFCSLLDVL